MRLLFLGGKYHVFTRGAVLNKSAGVAKNGHFGGFRGIRLSQDSYYREQVSGRRPNGPFLTVFGGPQNTTCSRQCLT